jgi:hypothetical protein
MELDIERKVLSVVFASNRFGVKSLKSVQIVGIFALVPVQE